jgi:drug/metabolite transporter (DMT)-like permease
LPESTLPQAGRAHNRIFVLLAAFLFSTGGAAIKACSLSNWQVAGFRSGIAALVFLIAIPDALRNWNWRAFAVGVAYATTLVSFVTANKLTTSANAIFLQDTAPLYLLLIGPLLLREKLRAVDLGVMAAVMCGAALLLGGGAPAARTAPDPALGNEVALASGVAWALTIAGLRWVGRDARDLAAASRPVVIGNLIAFGVCLPLALPVGHTTATDIAVIAYLGIFQVGLAYVFLSRSLRFVPAVEASTLLLAEPVFNPVWTWLAHGERPGRFAIAGGAVIVLAAFIGAWLDRRKEENVAC